MSVCSFQSKLKKYLIFDNLCDVIIITLIRCVHLNIFFFLILCVCVCILFSFDITAHDSTSYLGTVIYSIIFDMR